MPELFRRYVPRWKLDTASASPMTSSVSEEVNTTVRPSVGEFLEVRA